MEFTYNGKKVILRGTKQATLQWMTRKEYTKSVTKNVAELASLSLCVYLISLMIATVIPHEEDIGIELAHLLEELKDVFEVPTTLPHHRDQDHIIMLQEGTQPVNVRPYKHPPTKKDAIELMVKELLEARVIREIHSLFSSTIVMVKKKD
ncbi:hypothetical protein Tco_1191985 [Tanacetum coccineum]